MPELQKAVDQQPANTAPQSSLSLLASETFGAKFHGEVKAPEADKPEGAETKPEETAVEAPEADTSNPDATADAGGADGEHNTVETADGLKAADALPSTIEDYDWGEGVDWKTIQAPVKIDGQEATVPLADLVKSYQIDKAAEKRLAEANALKDQARQALETKEQELTGHFVTAAKLIEKVEKQLDQDTSGIDWAKLREDDPAEYSAKKTELKERRDQIEAMKHEARDSYQKAVAEAQKEQKEQLQQIVAAEGAKLLEKLPEWQTPETAKAEKAKIVGYLQTQGFDEKDIMGAVDHRLILMARKAMLYDEGQTKVAVAKKKVALVPKVMKPGAPKSKDQINQDRLKAMHGQLKKSGKIDDAYALLMAKRGK